MEEVCTDGNFPRKPHEKDVRGFLPRVPSGFVDLGSVPRAFRSPPHGVLEAPDEVRLDFTHASSGGLANTMTFSPSKRIPAAGRTSGPSIKRRLAMNALEMLSLASFVLRPTRYAHESAMQALANPTPRIATMARSDAVSGMGTVKANHAPTR